MHHFSKLALEIDSESDFQFVFFSLGEQQCDGSEVSYHEAKCIICLIATTFGYCFRHGKALFRLYSNVGKTIKTLRNM